MDLFLSNSVEFIAKGSENEKFLNYCIKNGIEISYPKNNNYILEGKIKAKDYKKLRKPARKLGLIIRIKRKSGIGFYIRKNYRKIGLFFGIITVFSAFLLRILLRDMYLVILLKKAEKIFGFSGGILFHTPR